MNNKKKYIVRCDIEGVSGVVDYCQAEPGAAEFEFGCRMFHSDLLALIEGLNNGGADEIIVYDEHYYGRNVDLSLMPENVSVICGKPPYRPDWAGGLDESCTGLILLGFHSMRGTGELLHHSYEPDIAQLILNDIPVGEIGIEAAIAGDWGVPLQLITADSAGVEEAQKLIQDVVGVSVKESLCETGGNCLSTGKTSRLFREAAEAIVTHAPSAKPWKVTNPKLDIIFNGGPYLDEFKKTFGPQMKDEKSILLSGPTVTHIWSEYWHMKLRTQEAMQQS